MASLLRLPSQLILPPPFSCTSSTQSIHKLCITSFPKHQHKYYLQLKTRTNNNISVFVTAAGANEDTKSVAVESTGDDNVEDEDDDEYEDPDPQDLEYVAQIKRVLELLKKNRDMLFNEVKLTVMIEDPREVERKRLLGIDDADTPTREDLAAVLEEVNEGKIPRDRIALQMLADEMVQWPNLEVEATKKGPRKSLYAKATDTGVDPEVAAKRLNIDWDTAAEIEEEVASDESEVPSLVGYGALYLVTAFPVIIGISVVLILFYNSLQ